MEVQTNSKSSTYSELITKVKLRFMSIIHRPGNGDNDPDNCCDAGLDLRRKIVNLFNFATLA